MRGALAASYSRDWWRISAGVTQDLSKKKEGAKGGLDFTAIYHVSDRVTLDAGPGVTFANGENTRTFFGVTPLQSTRSGYAVYSFIQHLQEVPAGGDSQRLDSDPSRMEPMSENADVEARPQREADRLEGGARSLRRCLADILRYNDPDREVDLDDAEELEAPDANEEEQ